MSNLRQQIRDYFNSQPLHSEKAEEILRAGKEAAATEGRIVPWRRWTVALALAAALIVFAGLAYRVMPSRSAPVPFAALAPQVIKFFGSESALPKVSQDKAALREWHLAHGAPASFAVPASLLALESFGCGIVDVQGRPAYLTCFWRIKKADGSGGELIHLLAARSDDFRDGPAGREPQTRELDGWSFASWRESGVIYTLAANAPLETVRAYVRSVPLAPSVAEIIF